MRFLIIIPAHNEQEYILSCLESLENQDFQDFECVVVNDGSTDNTKGFVEEFALSHPKFRLKNLDKSNHQPGSKVVRAFHQGLKEIDLSRFHIICKFDADIVFPKNYLSEIHSVYQKHERAGMVSGLVFIKKNGEWQFEDISSKNHVRGPIKSYRKDCLFAMNGLREVLGWDNIDVMLAKMYGYEVFTIKNIWVKHLRPTAYKYKNQKAEKLGEYFYNIGLNLPLAVISSLKSSIKNRSVLEFFITMKSFLKQNQERELSEEEIKFIRDLRWSEMRKKFF